MSIIDEYGDLFLFICSVLFYCSPVINLISVMNDKERRKNFPAFFLIFGSLNSFYWISIGIIKESKNGPHLMQGILGAMLLSIWLILYIINTSMSKFSSTIHIIIFLIFETILLVFIVKIISNKEFLNILYLILNLIMFLTPLLPLILNEGWEHKNIPIFISLSGLLYSISWLIFVIRKNENYLKIITWSVSSLICLIQIILYYAYMCKKDKKEDITVSKTIDSKEPLNDSEKGSVIEKNGEKL